MLNIYSSTAIYLLWFWVILTFLSYPLQLNSLQFRAHIYIYPAIPFESSLILHHCYHTCPRHTIHTHLRSTLMGTKPLLCPSNISPRSSSFHVYLFPAIHARVLAIALSSVSQSPEMRLVISSLIRNSPLLVLFSTLWVPSLSSSIFFSLFFLFFNSLSSAYIFGVNSVFGI